LKASLPLSTRPLLKTGTVAMTRPAQNWSSCAAGIPINTGKLNTDDDSPLLGKLISSSVVFRGKREAFAVENVLRPALEGVRAT
jgi:hypothetical protein